MEAWKKDIYLRLNGWWVKSFLEALLRGRWLMWVSLRRMTKCGRWTSSGRTLTLCKVIVVQRIRPCDEHPSDMPRWLTVRLERQSEVKLSKTLCTILWDLIFILELIVPKFQSVNITQPRNIVSLSLEISIINNHSRLYHFWYFWYFQQPNPLLSRNYWRVFNWAKWPCLYA